MPGRVPWPVTLDDNPNRDPNGPWVHNAEICFVGNASDQEKLMACVASRWVNR